MSITSNEHRMASLIRGVGAVRCSGAPSSGAPRASLDVLLSPGEKEGSGAEGGSPSSGLSGSCRGGGSGDDEATGAGLPHLVQKTYSSSSSAPHLAQNIHDPLRGNSATPPRLCAWARLVSTQRVSARRADNAGRAV